MEEIAISKFKATCLAVLEQVRKTGQPVLVTRFGKAIAEVVPPPPNPREKGWLGALQKTGVISGDIVETDDDENWEILSE